MLLNLLMIAMIFIVTTLRGETAEQIADIKVARAELNIEIQNNLFWGSWLGYNQYPDEFADMYVKSGYNDAAFQPNANKVIPSRKFITVLNDLPRVTGNVKSGREIIIPMTTRMKSYPKFGRQRLAGAEEELEKRWASVLVKITRQGLTPDDMEALQTTSWAMSYQKYTAMFAPWWASWHDSEMTRALYEGYSANITDTLGYNISKRYPKNFLYQDEANTSQVTWSATPATYKASIISALGALTTTDIFTTDTLNTLEAKMVSLKIPFNKDGSRSIVIHPLQLKTLVEDVVFRDAVSGGALAAGTSPLISGKNYRWRNWNIYVSAMGARIAYANGTTLEFMDASGGDVDTSAGRDDAYWIDPQTTGTYQHAACAIVFCEDMPGLYKANGAGWAVYGNSIAVAGGSYYGSPMIPGSSVFANVALAPVRVDDYGMNTGIGSMDDYGYAAYGFYDQLITGSTAPTTMADQPFAIIATYVA